MYIKINNLNIDEKLLNLINEEILPQTEIKKADFWKNFEDIINQLTPENISLLKKKR